jgi:hypothetical protein
MALLVFDAEYAGQYPVEVGAYVGAKLYDGETVEGLTDGANEYVGIAEGRTDGMVEGRTDGVAVGSSVGTAVGGTVDGLDDGANE